MQTAAVILDLYDDVHGQVLRETLRGRAEPGFFKEAQLLDADSLSRLPDRMFALVGWDGDEKLRKYAMHDAPHVATSVAYFLKRAHLIPESARNAAAINLVNGCEWYDIEPPAELLKMAMIGAAMGTMAMGGMASDAHQKHQRQMDQFRAAQSQAQPPAAGAMAQGSQNVAKVGELQGSEVMPMSGTISSKPTKHRHSASTWSNAAKTAAAQLPREWLGPFRLDGQPRQKVAAARARQYAVPSLERYPLDTYEQVKEASAYFEEWSHQMDPATRYEFARNVSARCSELGFSPGAKVAAHAGTEYGDYLVPELLGRVRAFEGMEGGELYEALYEKRAEVEPAEMVELLGDVDRATGVDATYGRPVTGFRDPFASVFGKVASDTSIDPNKALEWMWSEGNDYVNGSQLHDLAENRLKTVVATLGDDFAQQFKKEPIDFFEALPDPQKHVLARLASNNSGGSYRQ